MRYGYRDLPWRDEVARELGIVGDPIRSAAALAAGMPARAFTHRGIPDIPASQPDAPHRAMTHRGLEGFGQTFTQTPGGVVRLPGIFDVIGQTIQGGLNLYTQARDAASGRSSDRAAIALAQAQSETERARAQIAALESSKSTRTMLFVGGGLALAAILVFGRRRR